MSAYHSGERGTVSIRAWAAVGALALLAWSSSGRAQGLGIWHTYLNSNQVSGLAAQGEDIWAATAGGGAVRLSADGTFTQWTRSVQGLLSDTLSGVELDHSGRIWFGTQSHGISILDPRLGRWTPFTSLTERIPGDAIQRIHFSGTADSETLYVGAYQGYAAFRNGNVIQSCQSGFDICGNLNPDVRDLLPDGDSLWIATAAGATVQYPVRGGQPAGWRNYYSGLSGSPLVGLARTDSLYAFGPETMWVWNETGPANHTWSRVPSDGLRSGFHCVDMLAYKDTLWVADSSGVSLHGQAVGGVFRRVGHGAWSQVGQALVGVTALARTASGRLWAGASDPAETWDGIWSFSGNEWVQHKNPGPSLLSQYLSLDFDAGGALWLSSVKLKSGRAPMISRYREGRWDFYPGHSAGHWSNQSTQIVMSAAGSMWLGHCCCWRTLPDTPDSLCGTERVSNEPPRFEIFHDINDVWDATQDDLGYIWLATQNSEASRQHGLYRLDPTNLSKMQFTGDPLRTDNLSAVRVNRSDGALFVWIGYTDRGISRWNLGRDGQPGGDADSWDHFTTLDSLIDNHVTCIRIAPDGSAWVGTENGISIINGFSFRNILAGFGQLPTGRVNDIIPTRDGGAWIATKGGGLTHATPAERGFNFEFFGPPNVPNPNISAMTMGPDGRTIWMATDSGLASFFPPQATGSTEQTGAYPNPFRLHCSLDQGVRLVGTGGASSGVVVDLSGKVMARFHDRAVDEPVWNGKQGAVDGSGGSANVSPGLYWVRATGPTGVHSIGVVVMDADCTQ